MNPPLINGVAFTRQGRCQEREEVLGTTKPPYSLALIASLLRDAGCEVRLVDMTAERCRSAQLIARLDADRFRADPDSVSEHDADARRGRVGDGEVEGALRRADVLLRSARVDDAGAVDAAGASR